MSFLDIQRSCHKDNFLMSFQEINFLRPLELNNAKSMAKPVQKEE